MKLTIKDIVRTDIEDIRKYISEDLQNPIAAENTVRKIYGSISKLKDSPYIGTLLRTKADLPYPYRFLPSGTYVIIYKIHHDCVTVLRVYNCRRDYIRDFFSRFPEIDREDEQ